MTKLDADFEPTLIGGWLRRLAGMPHKAKKSAGLVPPAVTRNEVALWYAESVADELRAAFRSLGRPGVAILRCQFSGFQDDLRVGLEEVLGDSLSFEVISEWPADVSAVRSATRDTVDSLNAGRSRIFVVPHERVLSLHLPSVDAVLMLGRFTSDSLAEACRRFYDLDSLPSVPDEPWVPLVCPTDLLISSAASGDPIPAIRDIARRRLQAHDCSEAAPLDSLLGLNEVRAWANALLEDIRDARDPQMLCRWADIERAVVFAGPKAVGKTSLSRALARSAGMHWIKVSARRWADAMETERWQSAGERPASVMAIEADFDAARQLAPAVMFIEDLGCLTAELAATVGRVVAEGDDLNPIIVIGSATDVDLPGDALLRAAGFEHTIYLPLPSSTMLATALQERLAHISHRLSVPHARQVGRLALV
jgi:hypothetical protein